MNNMNTTWARKSQQARITPNRTQFIQ